MWLEISKHFLMPSKIWLLVFFLFGCLEFARKKVSGKNDTITSNIFVFSLICACTEFISKNAVTWKYLNMNF